MRWRRRPQLTDAASIEADLASIWARALERASVSLDEDFFELGGDSLAALTIAGEVSDAFGVEVFLDTFATKRTVRELAQLVAAQVGAQPPARPAAPVAGAASEYPLTVLQEEIWRLCQSERGTGAYTMKSETDLSGGEIDFERLRECVRCVVERHASLRTVFRAGPEGPRQLVLADAGVETVLVDLTAASDPGAALGAASKAAANMRFDLERGPLMTVLLYRLASDSYRVMLVFHHIIGDAMTPSQFWIELCERYEALSAGVPPPIPREPPPLYGEFAARQRASLSSGSGPVAEQLQWWREQFRDAGPALVLPFEREQADPDARREDGERSRTLELETARRLDSLAAEVGVTFFNLRLAGYAAQLALDTGRHDFVLGSYIAGRSRPELRDTIGLFSHLVALRLCFDPELSLRDWLDRVRSAVLEMNRNGDVPYQTVTERLAAEGIAAPPITAIFSVARYQPPRPLDGLDTRTGDGAARSSRMPWGVTLRAMSRGPYGRQLQASFDARIHDPARVEAFLGRVELLLDLAGSSPDLALGALLDTRAGAGSGVGAR